MDKINLAILGYCENETRKILSDIMTDFERQCEDPKYTELLQSIIDSYQNTELSKEIRVSNRSLNLELQQVIPRQQVDNTGCISKIQSGARKGEMCGAKIHLNSLCKRHSPKEDENKCSFIMEKGVKIGQPCGKCIPFGELFCAKHKTNQCKHVSECGKVCNQPISIYSKAESSCRVHLIEELQIDTSKFVTYTNKFGNTEHKYSGFIFENGKVVGIQNTNGTTSTVLNENDFECVIKYGLPIDDFFKNQLIDYLNKKK